MDKISQSGGSVEPGGPITALYPDIIPAEEGHPTSAQFEVVNTGDEQGRGMRSRVFFRKGERVAKLSGILVSHTTLDTIQLSGQLHFSDPWFCRFLLHSCDPNTVIDTASLAARAARDIEPGEYVTIDYSATEDRIARQFPCQCGSRNCRRWMAGRLEAPNEEGRTFLARQQDSRGRGQ
jgi:hypothetical protein